MTVEQTLDKKHLLLSYGTAIVVILFLIVTTANFATWKADINAQNHELEAKIINIDISIIDIYNDIDYLQDKSNTRDVDIATINTKLANIEVLLVEIKQDIKDQH